jgi:hypothetical protein
MRSLLIVLTLSLAACASPIETRIDSTGLSPVEPVTFQIDEAASADAKPLVAAALVQIGFVQATVGEYSLQVTSSDRPAELSLKNGTETLSPSAGKMRCADREYRLGLTLTRIVDGAVAYRALAAEFHCKLKLAEVLPVLVSSALADLGAPRGAYIVKRPRRSPARPLQATSG